MGPMNSLHYSAQPTVCNTVSIHSSKQSNILLKQSGGLGSLTTYQFKACLASSGCATDCRNNYRSHCAICEYNYNFWMPPSVVPFTK